MADSADREVHEVHDSKVLAAMSHPLRRRLLDVLRLDGPSTASVLAERTGQAVGNVSHHLKVLAASDLVEEAPELARDRRERWWRRVGYAVSWSPSDFPDDPVAAAAESLALERQVSMARQWFAERETYPEEWHRAAFATDSWAKMSVAELAELEQKVHELIKSYSGREIPDDGQERRPVFIATRAVPARP
ncbi:helix-turn-helix domain-containing protein [Amycolatopsis keratiniphila]|uniref:Regulatory protein ArsR n=1 Tax=Amycolatopsis keratiniphila TaxID=129921 RepID=R4T2X7_9PSEU|nr:MULTISPECIES: helix-turn-helix domain-containing protein [Amycolatopsis]AGM09924.1 regulatory protein ArsR [Amycolatopsis keratiniphila]RSN19796.1 ArsR family transcriptional regulator [Amycolatopsis sp. WAC 04169]